MAHASVQLEAGNSSLEKRDNCCKRAVLVTELKLNILSTGFKDVFSSPITTNRLMPSLDAREKARILVHGTCP